MTLTKGHIDQGHPNVIKVIIFFIYIYDTTSTNDTIEGKDLKYKFHWNLYMEKNHQKTFSCILPKIESGDLEDWGIIVTIHH